MKIRTGFVSNSSSSSFCLFGICVPHTKKMKCIEGLSSHFGISDIPEDYIVIGLPPEGINDDETGLEFKTRVKKIIENHKKDLNLENEDLIYEWHSDGRYNG